LIALFCLLLIAIPAVASTRQITIPTFTITDVVEGDAVTIKGVNFIPNDKYKVTMGKFGTKGVGGVVITTQDAGTGSFTATYDIPASLAGEYKIAIRLQSADTGYYSYNWFFNKSASSGGTPPSGATWGYPPAGAATIPKTTIGDVTPGVDVKVSGTNFTTTEIYAVFIGKFGTKGVGGIKVGEQETDAAGKFNATYAIPASLKDENKLAIRFVGTKSGYYAYDWFTNKAGAGATPPPAKPGTIPTFTITTVVKDSKVTISAKNFTLNDSYKVTMGKMGTKGVGGVLVATQPTDGSGTFTATYDIPASLHGDSQIAIRLQSPTTGYYSYNWFWNSNHP
jgi:hypothetical protein